MSVLKQIEASNIGGGNVSTKLSTPSVCRICICQVEMLLVFYGIIFHFNHQRCPLQNVK